MSPERSSEDLGPEDAGPSGAHAAPGPHDTAAYLAEITGELSKLASGAGLDLLAYLLEMARLEANKSMRILSPDRTAR